MDRTNYKGINTIKIKSWLLKLCIIMYIIISSSTYSNAGEISCRYYSDHNKQENIGMMSEIAGGIADLFTGGAASTISHGASAVGLASQVNDHKIYCIYTMNKDNQEKSDKIFYELVRSKEIMPVFLYENLAQKKIEQCQLSDINPPFSDARQRDKTAKDHEFVFSSKTAISDIKYFGFIQPKNNNIIMYYVNPKTMQLREPSYKQWKEINEEYLR